MKVKAYHPRYEDEETLGIPAEGKPLYDTNGDVNGAASNQIDKFRVSGYRDVWAALLFIAAVLATVAVGAKNIHDHKLDFMMHHNHNDTNHGHHARVHVANAFEYIVGAAAAAVLLACLAMSVIKAAPRGAIYACNIGYIAVFFASGAYLYAKTKNPYIAVWFGLIGLFLTIWFYCVRRRIPFAALLLKTSTGLVTRFYGMIVISFVSLAVTVIYVALWVGMAAPSIHNMNEGSNGVSGRDIGILFLLLIVLFWGTQVITNVVHVSAAGACATWYYAGDDNVPKNPTVASLKRALTTSFGSICFGSLIVAILKTIYTMARLFQGSRNSLLRCIVLILLRIIERLVEYFNIYAYTYIAIYGSSYVEAAKQTWQLVKSCAVEAIFTNCLCFPVLNITALGNSVVVGVASGVIAHHQAGETNASSAVVLGVVCFIVSWVVHIIMLRGIFSCVVTIFVCFAENPEALYLSNPEFQQRITEAQNEAQQSTC